MNHKIPKGERIFLKYQLILQWWKVVVFGNHLFWFRFLSKIPWKIRSKLSNLTNQFLPTEIIFLPEGASPVATMNL